MNPMTLKEEKKQNNQNQNAIEPKSILKVRDLNIYYGDNHAVHQINMDIPEHSVTAFIGPSGCGKSTFLRSINRMNDLIPIARFDGEIIYDDVNLLSPKIDVVNLRKEIGMVFQKPNPFPKSIYQ